MLIEANLAAQRDEAPLAARRSLDWRELRVREVRSLDELVTYEAAWDHLLAITPRANFFQSHEWLATYWEHFGNAQGLRLLLVFDGGRLAGVLPLVARQVASPLGRLHVVGYPLDNWGTHYGPIGGNPRATLAAGFKYLAEHQRDWDVLELDWISEHQLDAVTWAARRAGLRGITQASEETSVIDLSGNWDDYWRARSSKFRNNLRRNAKRLARMGQVSLVHYRSSDSRRDPRWDLYELCEQVASSSWQGASTSGNTITHAQVQPFLREVHREGSRRGCVAMHVLLVDGQPVAFSYNYVFRQEVFGLRMGFAKQFADAGPGAVLLQHMIQDCFHRGDRRIVLGEGDARYKHQWRTHATATHQLRRYSRASLRAQVMRLKHWVGNHLMRPRSR